MVALGGITRLTGSGLSITEWKPVMGALPPMNERQWEQAFEKYKAIPQARLINAHFELGDFKAIFFWEYLHRNWGRLLGVIFIVPFLLFLRRGLLRGWLLKRSIAILLAGGAVGVLGWFMVMSGLVDDPDVSHYRLAVHLLAAFAVFALVLWTLADLRHGRRSFLRPIGHGRAMRWMLLLLLVQITWGAFTAGLDGGMVHNTWPLMSGEFMPATVRGDGGPWSGLIAHRDGVQFIHRNLAWVVALAVLGIAWRVRKDRTLVRSAVLLVAAVLLQFVLGVLALLTQVNIVLGVAHQLGALLLLAVLVLAVHRTGRPVDA